MAGQKPFAAAAGAPQITVFLRSCERAPRFVSARQTGLSHSAASRREAKHARRKQWQLDLGLDGQRHGARLCPLVRRRRNRGVRDRRRHRRPHRRLPAGAGKARRFAGRRARHRRRRERPQQRPLLSPDEWYGGIERRFGAAQARLVAGRYATRWNWWKASYGAKTSTAVSSAWKATWSGLMRRRRAAPSPTRRWRACSTSSTPPCAPASRPSYCRQCRDWTCNWDRACAIRARPSSSRCSTWPGRRKSSWRRMRRRPRANGAVAQWRTAWVR